MNACEKQGQHLYHVKICTKCGKNFCYDCCGSTNVDQGGKHEPDYMYCPNCGHDYYSIDKTADEKSEKVLMVREPEGKPEEIYPVGTKYINCSLDNKFGMPLNEITDVKLLQTICEKLWKLLDNIDTLEDICKENDRCFRNNTRRYYKERFDCLTSDGYELFLPNDLSTSSLVFGDVNANIDTTSSIPVQMLAASVLMKVIKGLVVKSDDGSRDDYAEIMEKIIEIFPMSLVEQLSQLVYGPVWDGDIISPTNRDYLIKAGIAIRICHKGQQGYTGAKNIGDTILRRMNIR